MDSLEAILMSNPWDFKGCEYCRNIWRIGQRLPEIEVNLDEHTSLHHCSKCGCYWEMHERFVDVISPDAARVKYPNALI